MICHNDLFWPNVVFRGGVPVALIDWDLAVPAPRLFDVASAANHWVPLAHDERAVAWGLSSTRHGERLRLLCDAYGLTGDERLSLLDVVASRNALGFELHRLCGDEILARNAWFETQRSDLLAFLR